MQSPQKDFQFHLRNEWPMSSYSLSIVSHEMLLAQSWACSVLMSPILALIKLLVHWIGYFHESNRTAQTRPTSHRPFLLIH